MNDKVTFRNSQIIRITLLLFFMGALLSVIPKGNPVVFIINLSISLIAGMLFYIFWKKLKHHSKRYFSLLSFVMMNVLAIYFAMPLLRIYFLTIVFWTGLVILLVMNVLPYLYSREIAFGVQKPYKSKIGRIYIIYTALFFTFGGMAYSNTLYTQHTEALTIAIIAFLFSILLFFLSPIMLIKPNEMDKLMDR